MDKIEEEPKSSVNEPDRIHLLQMQVDQLQLKVFEEPKKKWYKNPSLLLSITAFCASLYFSVNSIIENRRSSHTQRISASLQMAKQSIEEILKEEEKLLAVFSNQYTDLPTRNNADLSFQARSRALLDKVDAVLNDQDSVLLAQIEPTILINYGRFLLGAQRFKRAYWVFESAKNLTDDKLTIVVCYRSLANILASQASEYFDSAASREMRRKDIEISMSLPNEMKVEYLVRSYELWALDEYFLLKNNEEGNRLIDSARHYASQFPDMSMSKAPTLSRLAESKNYYNDVLVQANIAGIYRYNTSDRKNGKAFVTSNVNGIRISLDQMEKGVLIGQMTGFGSFIDLQTLRFEVSMFNPHLGNSGGALNLIPVDGKRLIGDLHEFGKERVRYTLVKIQ